MNQLNKFHRSWLLLRGSFKVMMKNKRLLFFPIIIATFIIFIGLFFLGSFAINFITNPYNNILLSLQKSTFSMPFGEMFLQPAGIICACAFYCGPLFLAIFLNVAFCREILAAHNGESVSIWRGIRFAFTKLKPIFIWTLFAGLIGLLGIFGPVIMKFIGIAWSVASVFVILIIIREQQTVNPLNILKKSASTLKRTWGESLIGCLGLQFGGILVLLGSLLLLAGIIFVSNKVGNDLIVTIAVLGWFIGAFAFVYVLSVAVQIYLCALYIYDSEGIIPEPYNRELMDIDWNVKS